jgi:hypothetical protein
LAAEGDDQWFEWMVEAHGIVARWDAQRNGRILTTDEAAQLAEAIAQALARAFARGANQQVR